MKSSGHESVCSLIKVSNFGGLIPTNASRETRYVAYSDEAKTLEKFKKELIDITTEHANFYPSLQNMSAVFISAISTQKAAGYLSELFPDYDIHIPRYLKYRHGIHYYVVPVPVWCSVLGIPGPDLDQFSDYTDSFIKDKPARPSKGKK